MEDHSSHSENSEAGNEIDCQYPRQISSLERSFPNGSCYTSDSRNSGHEQCSLTQPREVINSISATEFLSVEGETDLSSSTSSTWMGDMGRKRMATSSLTDFTRSANWELEYVRAILSNAELRLKDFALGQAHKVITRNLFDQLENEESAMERNGEEYFKLERKILFDCVSECLDFRCGRISIRSCKAWSKRETLFKRKGWLADELYKEISGLRNIEDLMVDELVEKDMNTHRGRWLDFEIEAFEEGVEIEKEILSSLVDELVADLLF
ncbi:hypothetical protein L1049_020740 [Liquidambar formosana]|uniref:DUF4378 domain-containing protein n=1 Tax=Liquidambar formosana TaxID=63359 RepID=A0AAP0SDI1_LIQFO